MAAADKKIVLVFSQVTKTLLEKLTADGYVVKTETGYVPAEDYEFRFSAPPHNLKHSDKPDVKVFLDAVKAAGGFYNMPAYGAASDALGKSTLATASVIPYRVSIDMMAIGKMERAVAELIKWLKTPEIASDPANNAELIATSVDGTRKALLEFIAANQGLGEEEYQRRFLIPRFGADYSKVSKNFSVEHSMKLFGASDGLNAKFLTATFKTERGRDAKLSEEARWFDNALKLFKPTTEFSMGALSDMLNFAAMFSGKKFDGRLTDADSAEALHLFETRNIDERRAEIYRVDQAYFDAEPDDMAVVTCLTQLAPNCVVHLLFPTEQLQTDAEAFLKPRFEAMHLDGAPIIYEVDPEQQNGEVLGKIFKH